MMVSIVAPAKTAMFLRLKILVFLFPLPFHNRPFTLGKDHPSSVAGQSEPNMFVYTWYEKAEAFQGNPTSWTSVLAL